MNLLKISSAAALCCVNEVPVFRRLASRSNDPGWFRTSEGDTHIHVTCIHFMFMVHVLNTTSCRFTETKIKKWEIPDESLSSTKVTATLSILRTEIICVNKHEFGLYSRLLLTGRRHRETKSVSVPTGTNCSTSPLRRRFWPFVRPLCYIHVLKQEQTRSQSQALLGFSMCTIRRKSVFRHVRRISQNLHDVQDVPVLKITTLSCVQNVPSLAKQTHSAVSLCPKHPSKAFPSNNFIINILQGIFYMTPKKLILRNS